MRVWWWGQLYTLRMVAFLCVVGGGQLNILRMVVFLCVVVGGQLNILRMVVFLCVVVGPVVHIADGGLSVCVWGGGAQAGLTGRGGEGGVDRRVFLQVSSCLRRGGAKVYCVLV